METSPGRWRPRSICSASPASFILLFNKYWWDFNYVLLTLQVLEFNNEKDPFCQVGVTEVNNSNRVRSVPCRHQHSNIDSEMNELGNRAAGMCSVSHCSETRSGCWWEGSGCEGRIEVHDSGNRLWASNRFGFEAWLHNLLV